MRRSSCMAIPRPGAGSHAREFLGRLQWIPGNGWISGDTTNLPGIRRCSCWAHIRRYFIDAVPKGKQYDYSQPAVQGVQYCNRLFAIEDSINKKYPGDYEKRKQLRLEKEKPVLEAFWSWLDQQKPVRNTRLDKSGELCSQPARYGRDLSGRRTLQLYPTILVRMQSVHSQ